MGLMFPYLNVWLTSETPVALRGRAVGGLTTSVFLEAVYFPESRTTGRHGIRTWNSILGSRCAIDNLGFGVNSTPPADSCFYQIHPNYISGGYTS